MDCSYCGEKVAMPFTCKLCGKKLCAKHRLPERHECENIGHFNTSQYKIEKIQKAQEYREIKYTESSERTTGAPRLFNQSIWTSGDVGKNVIYGGVILSIVVILMFGLYSDWLLVTGAIILAPIQFYILYLLRRNYAKQFYLKTEFVFSPIGIAITLISSLFSFVILAFGFFYEEGGEDETGARIGIRGIFTSYGIYLVGTFILYPLFLIFNLHIFTAIFFTSNLFFWLAIINIIPWRGLDGKKIYDWNSRTYWKILIFLILAYIADRLFAITIVNSIISLIT